MKINKRGSKGWVESVENKDKGFCDVCNCKLWIAPHGGIYCNTPKCGDVIKQPTV